MPTYEYECKACRHRFEEFQSITERAHRKCPKCKKLKLVRLIGTGGAILFKGSGFYQTDYRSKNYREARKAESSSGGSETKDSGAGSSGTKSGTSSDST